MYKQLCSMFSALVLISISSPATSLPAFPGAEGFGSETPGGRGGTVIEVTNLNDSGTGSLRAALTATGPRIVVFRVAGTINLLSRITVTTPFLTVAGQTAPGDGITIKNDTSNGQGPIRISTHDVVMRFLRFRSGPSPNDGGTLDAFNMYPAPNVYNNVVDHCSFSWSTDEVFQTGGAHDFTIQWSILAEGLNNASHPEGAHSKGMHFEETNSNNISAHHNLLAHNYDRNPYINTTGTADVVNNIFYNATRWTEIKDTFGEPHVNIIGNYYKLGPSSDSGGYEVFYYNSMGRQPKVYVLGNIGFHRISDDLDENLIVRDDSRWMIVESRFPAPPVTTVSAFQAFEYVLAYAGATLPVRDAHDSRVVNDVRNGIGQIIDNPSQVGGWLEMNPGTPPADTDHDGMPDEWETTNGFNSTDITDGLQDADNDGYTNIEEYLNATDPGSPPIDSTPPMRSNGSPSSILPAGTAQTNLGLTTNENATCRYSPIAKNYDLMDPFATTGGTTHSTPISGLVDGSTYTFYVRCRDGAGNVNIDDFPISFTIATSFNQPPTVNAGADQTITLSNSAVLNATVSDDGLPAGSTVTVAWSQISGPGTASFDNPTAVNTAASFSGEGTYVLRLTASDGDKTAFDEIAITVQPPGAQSTVFESRVSASADDAEESASGKISLTSSDLELVFDGNNQTVGLRFNAVNIPKNASITQAYVQFKTDEAQSEATSLTIQGQNTDNAAAFTTATRNISSRAKTAASVAWTPGPWTTVGQAGSEQRTTDIAPIVQEIVNRSGWSGGNSLALVLSGTGHRTAEAFNGDQAGAPLLHVEYGIGPPVNQPPVVNAGSDQTITLPNSAALNATVSDDGLPAGSTVTVAWNQISGPGTVSFADPAAVNTMASFSAEGAYVLRLTADDSALTAFDEVAITVQPPGTQSNILEIRVAASADDAEESASGKISLTSSDLELVFDGNNQTVGLRFNAINIPKNAFITQAYVQFKTDETQSEATALTIKGQNADSAAAFTTTTRNISSRAATAASVLWAPVPWTAVGQTGSEQRTTDIAPIVQEIVNKSGWSAGNSLALIISGTGHRTAEAFNGDQAGAPLLHVEFTPP